MRTVFDSVIFVRALINPLGQWGQLIFERADEYELIVSPEIVAEYLDVVRRPELVRKYRTAANRNLEDVLDLIAVARIVQPLQVPEICRDPADDKFLAAALTASAEIIVTEDVDLLVLGSYEGIDICTAREFLRLLTEVQNVQGTWQE